MMRSESDPLTETGARSIVSELPRSARWKLSPYFSKLFQFLRQVGWGTLLSVGLVFLVIQVIVVSQGQTDFCQDYLAAQRLVQGIPVYQPLHCWAGALPIPTAVEYDTHPPFSALFFLPFGFLPKVPAYILWGLCCLVFYLISGFLLLRAVGWFTLRASALFVVGSFCWLLFRGAELFQNLPQLTILLLVVAWVLDRKGHTYWAGGLLGLATLLKIWPVVLLGYLLLRRRWQGAVTGTLVIITGTAITVPLLGLEAYQMYLGPVRANEASWVPWDGNSSLVGLITRSLYGLPDGPGGSLASLVGPMPLDQVVMVAEAVAGLLLVGTLVFLWWCAHSRQGEAVELLTYGLLLTMVLLIFPLSWYYGLIIILLPYTTTILALRQLPKIERVWFFLLGVSVVPLLGDISWMSAAALWIQHQFPALSGWATLVLGLPTFGLALFAGLQTYLLWQGRTLPHQGEHLAIPSQRGAEDRQYA